MSVAQRRRVGPPYLLDTHVWLWYLIGSPRLPQGLRREIDAALGDLWLSPISVWELCVLDRRGRVRLDPDPRTWVEQALERLPLEEAAVNREVALVSAGMDLAHRDPADRFLAATALVFGLTLMTVDERLTEAREVPTRSS